MNRKQLTWLLYWIVGSLLILSWSYMTNEATRIVCFLAGILFGIPALGTVLLIFIAWVHEQLGD